MIKYIVGAMWILLAAPVIIISFKQILDNFLPAPKSDTGFFVYLLTSRLAYLASLSWLIGPWFSIKKELGFVPASYALQQICWSFVFTTTLLSIKYYKTRHMPQTKPNE